MIVHTYFSRRYDCELNILSTRTSPFDVCVPKALENGKGLGLTAQYSENFRNRASLDKNEVVAYLLLMPGQLRSECPGIGGGKNDESQTEGVYFLDVYRLVIGMV